MARGRHHDGVGPERPTFVERAIAAVPLPYLVTCVILAVASQGPGLFLANLVDYGNVDAALRVTFPELATTAPLLLISSTAIGIGFYTALLYMIRYARRQLVTAGRDLSPLLPDGETGFRRIYGIVHDPLPICALAALLAVFFWTISAHAEAVSPAHVVFIGVQMAVICFSTATVLWTYFVSLWGLRQMGREPLRLRPYTEDPMLGLRPLGSMAVSATMIYFGMIGVVLLVTLIYPQTVPYLAFLLSLILFGVLLFLLPLLGIHRKMVEEKRRVEGELAEAAAREWKEMEASPGTVATDLSELRGMVVSLRQFVAHDRAERKVATLPTWPFDPEVTGRIAAIVLTGTVAVLGRAAVDWFLARP